MPSTVKATLTLMLSCGMYDYSGEWCVRVGLPAKSGVAGLVYIVIPNVMGIAVYSPRLDTVGNSVRAVTFFKHLMEVRRSPGSLFAYCILLSIGSHAHVSCFLAPCDLRSCIVRQPCAPYGLLR